jgi:hypothetical protein
MGTASRFDPGSLLCHRDDHRAYAAGRIAASHCHGKESSAIECTTAG